MGQRVSKQEIPEKFLVPQADFGLDSSKVRQVRKLVIKGKLAPFYPGKDDPGTSLRQHDECPICFLQFHSMNRSICCGQRICSECYIRIGASSRGSYFGTSCPFCKATGYIVELCGPKSEKEKAEEMLEEQRMRECRLRKMNEDRRLVDGINSSQFGYEAGNQIDLSSSLAEDSQNRLEDEHVTVAQTENEYQGTLSLIEDGYREEYEALSSEWRQRSVAHTLTTAEIQQCEEYLGIFPDDLGMHLEDFNELMLEQVLASSALDVHADQLDSSSHVSIDECVDAQSADDPSGSQRRDTPHPVTGRVLFRTTTSAPGISFDSPAGDGTLGNIARRDSCPDSCNLIDFTQHRDEVTEGAGQGSNSCAGAFAVNAHTPRSDSLPSGEWEHCSAWKLLIAKLALTGEVDHTCRTPHVGMVHSVSMGDSCPSNLPGSLDENNQCVISEEYAPSFVIFERMRVDDRNVPGQERGLGTAAVENPDGSLMLVTFQRESQQESPGASNDARLVGVIADQDAEVQNAVSRGDASTSQNQNDEQFARTIGHADRDLAERMRLADEELRRRLQT